MLLHQRLSSQERQVLFIAWASSTLEIFAFIVYAYLVTVVAQLFFYSEASYTNLLSGMALLAVTYFVRPIGAALFGALGDRYGRKVMFYWSIIIISLTSFAIGLLPTYQHIGFLAPLLLIFLKGLQALAMAGGLPGAAIYITEHVRNEHRGLACAALHTNLSIGTLLACSAAALVTAYLSEEALFAWGWRIPFLLAGMLGLLAAYLRIKLAESPLFLQLQKQQQVEKKPLRAVFKHHKRLMLISLLIIALAASNFSTFYVVMPTYLSTYFHFDDGLMLFINTLFLLICAGTTLLFGHFSDKWRRKNTLMIGAVVLAVIAYPLFTLLAKEALWAVIIVYSVGTLFTALFLAVAPLMPLELFATRVRYTGYALSLGLGIAIFSGLAPIAGFIAADWFGNLFSLALYISLTAILALIALLHVRETKGLTLSQV